MLQYRSTVKTLVSLSKFVRINLSMGVFTLLDDLKLAILMLSIAISLDWISR